MYTYIHTHIYVHIHMHTCKYTYAYMYTPKQGGRSHQTVPTVYRRMERSQVLGYLFLKTCSHFCRSLLTCRGLFLSHKQVSFDMLNLRVFVSHDMFSYVQVSFDFFSHKQVSFCHTIRSLLPTMYIRMERRQVLGYLSSLCICINLGLFCRYLGLFFIQVSFVYIVFRSLFQIFRSLLYLGLFCIYRRSFYVLACT